MKMKILVVGAGAVGGYFGARLEQAGRDVTFLVRPARAQQLQRDGLRILSPHGDLTLKPKIVTTQEISGTYDIIFLSVKAQALDQAIKDMAPAIGPETMIYPVLNGMRHIKILTKAFGERAVLGGVCIVVADLDEQERIVQIAPLQKLTYGELSGEITPRIRALDETFRNAGFDTELSANITQEMWQKWVMIASLGLVTCLLDGPIGEINAVPDGKQTVLQAIDECAAIATACGFPPPQSLIDNIRKQATTKDSKLTSSMYRDLKKGAHVEVETILGDLLERGHCYQVPAPLLQASCVRLRVYQNTLKSPSSTVDGHRT
jgi:2-dehydropantoate 2-reductase